jgi:NTP pyrophosphatase (non-canonical NTP hydrolase)
MVESNEFSLVEFENKIIDWQGKNFGKHFPEDIINKLGQIKYELETIPMSIDLITYPLINECINELSKSIGYRNLLGAVEEIGELSHAQLKGEQGIRHAPYEILEKKKDAVGDVIIYLINYCNANGFTLLECMKQAWNEIKNRNWNDNKINGVTK